MNWLLIFVPVAIALEHFARKQHLLDFRLRALAIVPLAGWLGRATEQLAERTGEGIGGLLNATFGNAAELIIAPRGAARGLLRRGQGVDRRLDHRQYPAGARGGDALRRPRPSPSSTYNAAGARSQATMLTLAVIALILPAAYPPSRRRGACAELGPISVWISLVLIAVYAANLVFSLVTNRKLFEGRVKPTAEHDAGRGVSAGRRSCWRRHGGDRLDERNPGRRHRTRRGRHWASTTCLSACSWWPYSATPPSTRPPSSRR